MNIDYPTREQIPALRTLWKQAFGDTDAFLDLFFSTAYAPRRCRCTNAQGQTVAALYWFDCTADGEKFAYLYAVATDPAFRGQGLCRRLMDDTHRLLKEQGYAGTVLVPGEPELFAMYEKMGYTDLSGAGNFSVSTGSPISLRQVTAEEYAAARRALLPPGSIVQEGENLRFLGSYAKLYAGNGFVLAGITEGTHLYCTELLGDRTAAPGIVSALGMQTGTFRTPGEDRFSMYHPLKDIPAPRYFGLAFD